jgi:hypothetical protein
MPGKTSKIFSKKHLGLKIIIVAIILFVVFLYFYGQGVSGANIFDSIKNGWIKLTYIVNPPDSLAPADETPADDDASPDDDGTGSWHSYSYVGEGTTEEHGLDEVYFNLGAIPPFLQGQGDITISFYHSWTEHGSCAPCSPGVIWCVHDSYCNQIYHDEEFSPTSGTDSIMGSWDGLTAWKVFFGNNCDCEADFNFKIIVNWFG